jgi:redox-sensing transcriptional repressor
MLDNLHVEYVSSTQISKELNVQSSQIAKDLSFLNIRGKTRIGYEVSSLVTELEDFLGFNQHHNAVVIGTGSLGMALMQDHGLENYGLNIVAGFDVRDEVIGQNIGGVPVYDINQLAECVVTMTCRLPFSRCLWSGLSSQPIWR